MTISVGLHNEKEHPLVNVSRYARSSYCFSCVGSYLLQTIGQYLAIRACVRSRIGRGQPEKKLEELVVVEA